MRGLRRSARLIGAPFKNEGIGVLPANPIARERASSIERRERSPRRSFKVSRETSNAPKMLADARRGSHKSTREFKVVEFEQLRQTASISMDEHTDKFVDLLQYKAKKYTHRLHSKYSLLILATETHNFHALINAARKMKKNKSYNRIKSSLGMGSEYSSSSNTYGCVRCGKPHQEPYKFGTSECYRCGQEGHKLRECPNMERLASQ
ncbi:hypothetical protein P3X46_025347 [Hevea brasiliensis]|uniref:CCHC-type domain-containing protein n=1 Tax=Hevea brasiliensis TaxID=3981 RepID=A0ABQ9L6D6_HEVBR|nr:hypothetical protein P3X46_025347 [Hevea brasiliensis]